MTSLGPLCRPLPPSRNNGTEFLRHFKRTQPCVSARVSCVTASTAGRRTANHQLVGRLSPDRRPKRSGAQWSRLFGALLELVDVGSCMHGLASLDAPVWFDSVCAGGRMREKVTLCP